MAKRTFSDVIRGGGYLILDTETTGLHDAEICQIAVIDQAGTPLLDTLVKTVYPIPADAQRIHGISTAMVQSAPTFAEVRPRLLELLTGCDVIVFNADYDRRMLHESAKQAGLEPVEWKTVARWWCAMQAFAAVYGERNTRYGGFKWKSLAFAAGHYGVTVDVAHTALGDCLTTLEVVRGMAAGAEK
jgi:DNA polymerase III subunit epsilon